GGRVTRVPNFYRVDAFVLETLEHLATAAILGMGERGDAAGAANERRHLGDLREGLGNVSRTAATQKAVERLVEALDDTPRQQGTSDVRPAHGGPSGLGIEIGAGEHDAEPGEEDEYALAALRAGFPSPVQEGREGRFIVPQRVA